VRAGDAPAPTLAEVGRETTARRVELHGLPEDSLAELVAAYREDPPTPAFVSDVRAHTGGNPFFVVEFLRHLGRTGEARLARAGVPAGVREVVGARVHALGEPAATLLRTAAVVGDEFDTALVEEVAGVGTHAALDAFEAALAAGLLREAPPGRPRSCTRSSARRSVPR
jgi:predicted ATPase